MRSLYNPDHTRRFADALIVPIAERQHGLVTRQQALSVGLTVGAIKWRVRSGRWSTAYPGVFRIAGAPRMWDQRAMGACLHLGPHAFVSFRSAVVLWEMGITTKRVEVTVSASRNRSRKDGITIHVSNRALTPVEVTAVRSIPVTAPGRTLLDIATILPADIVEMCLDGALRRRLVTVSSLDRSTADPLYQNHRGRPILEKLVRDRVTAGAPESPLETRLLQLLRATGLPPPTVQHVVTDEGRFIARGDFAYPNHRLAIEVDGFRHHDTRLTFDRERARGNALEALGWRVLRVTAAHDPETVATWIRRALRD